MLRWLNNEATPARDGDGSRSRTRRRGSILHFPACVLMKLWAMANGPGWLHVSPATACGVVCLISALIIAVPTTNILILYYYESYFKKYWQTIC